MVWAWLRNIARKRGRCTRGLGLCPSRFLLSSCYFGAFSLYLYHQGDVRHRPLYYEYLISNLAGAGFPPPPPSPPCIRHCRCGGALTPPPFRRVCRRSQNGSDSSERSDYPRCRASPSGEHWGVGVWRKRHAHIYAVWPHYLSNL